MPPILPGDHGQGNRPTRRIVPSGGGLPPGGPGPSGGSRHERGAAPRSCPACHDRPAAYAVGVAPGEATGEAAAAGISLQSAT